MLSVAESERKHYLSAIAEGTLLNNAIESVVKHTPRRVWDGMIHSSKLDWNKDPQRQFDDHLSNYSFGSTYTRAGDLYHEDFQKVLDSFFGAQNAYPEYRFQFPDLHFQGTIDRLQLGTPIGNILLEFKTTSELQRDKTGGDRILNGFLKYAPEQNITHSKFWIDNEANILDRLRTKTRTCEPQSNHLTQMFSYVWAMSASVQIDWAVLVYISRDSYKVVGEFWYPISENQTKVNRAVTNLMEVRQCLLNHQAQQTSG